MEKKVKETLKGWLLPVWRVRAAIAWSFSGSGLEQFIGWNKGFWRW